jgi:MATE family multidrug resistance protein
MAQDLPSQAHTLAWRTELSATLRLAGPLALTNLLQMAIYAVDVIFVARLGAVPLAAASLGVAVYGLILWALSGLTGSVAALIAEEVGRKRHSVREVRRSVRMGLWMAVITGLAGTAACFAGAPLMRLTGQDPEVTALATSYLAILSIGMVPMVMASVLRSFLAALGRPVFTSVVAALMIGVNALGNYILIFGNWGAPALGLDGAAIASVLTAFAFLATYAIAIARDRRLRRFAIWGRWWVSDGERFRLLWRIGAPVAVTIVAEAGIFNAAAFMMGAISPLALAAHTLALQIAAIAFQVPFGIGQAATIRVGYHFGAGNRDAMGRAGWVAIATGISFMVLTAGAMILMPNLLLGLYVDTVDPANGPMLVLALQFMVVAAAFQLVDGAQAVALGALRGLQDTRVPMAIAIFGYWVPGLACCLLLGFYTPLAGLGVWIGLAVGLLVVAIMLIARWVARERLGLVRV